VNLHKNIPFRQIFRHRHHIDGIRHE
jgi:hypothetical protein